MALDVNTGYNNVFKTFVDFAEQTHTHGHDTATAKATLSGRTITVSSVSLYASTRFLSTASERAANDATRASFRAAIIDMFGGEDKIPANVKDAMRLEDYGCGKPLTSRRILAVKSAIDSNKEMLIERARNLGSVVRQDSFKSPDVEAKALEMGFSRAELSNLARATALYGEVSGTADEMAAMLEVAKSGSKANRLMRYGGRFLESAENFKAGMELIDSFKGWFDGTVNGLEAMIFQDLAADSAANLKETDPEKLFGMKNNAAMRFYGHNCHESMLGTVFNLPHDKRRLLFAAADAFLPLYESQAQIREKTGRDAPLLIKNPRLFAARVLNHIDELAELKGKGQLSAKNIIKICFPDIKKTGSYDLKTLNDWFDKIDAKLDAAGLTEENGRAERTMVKNWMAETGCTFKEAVKSLREGTTPPLGAYQTGYSIQLQNFPEGGLDLMASDLKRISNYSLFDGKGKVNAGDTLISEADCHHKLIFPDGTVLACGSQPELNGNADKAVEKVRKLCGEVHGLQAQIVGACLSQSANAPLRCALNSYGIYASDNAALDYTLSKDESTGAINIRYSSPASLPVRFSWTCTVNVDGTCTTTPFTVTADMRSIGAIGERKAREMINESAKILGLEKRLDEEGLRDTIVSHLRQYGSGLPIMTARILSNYLVETAVNGGGSEEAVAKLANEMRGWRMFGFGDQRLAEVGKTIVEHQNAYVKAKFNDVHAFSNDYPNVFDSFVCDANRGIWTINGKRFEMGTPPKTIVDEFCSVIKAPDTQKAISSLFHQGIFGDLEFLFIRQTVPTQGIYQKEVNLHEQKGGEMFISRDIRDDSGNTPFKPGKNLHFRLDVSPDGKTAVIALSMDKEMISYDGNHNKTIGTATIAQRSTIDLTKAIPEVTNVTFSQEYTADKTFIPDDQ